ncbi:formin-J-like [Sergentomyia squamirostris]
MDANESSSGTCYGGGDLATAIILTIIFGIILLVLLRWLYNKYWLNRKGTHLVQEDIETGKSAEYAFDNPAFKSEAKGGTGSIGGGIKESKLVSKENGSTLEDNSTPLPTRNVSLRGSDFTGLGIELTGGLKDGIYVKKIASQGPAAGIVNIGDRITSITIDFRHIVQEDAAAILSYASPYNVRLDLAEAKTGVVVTPSPKSGHTSMIQPYGRSTSQSDTSSIDRNVKKNLFPGDVNIDTKPAQIHTVHKENEKKLSFTQQVKGLIEEKLQHKNDVTKTHDEPDKVIPSSSPVDKSKGLKFGIRVLPPNVNEKIFGKSPTKVQADNENNVNLEKNDTDDAKTHQESVPPVAQKRKEKKPIESTEVTFERNDEITSSGIKRDAAGIPQEVPEHMMQAAMSAKENRKSAVLDAAKKSKGKAPSPPPTDIVEVMAEKIDLNFTDNFVNEKRPSASSTPKSERKKNPSDTESQLADRTGDSDVEAESSSHIELTANHITVHQLSDEEEGRRTASLGDLSKIEGTKSPTGGRSNTATLERAQSLEITEQPAAPVTPKKRKAPAIDVDIFIEKEPRLSLDMGGGMEALRGRLKSANEWGNLEDAIYSIKDTDENHSSDTESLNRSEDGQKPTDNGSMNSMMKDIMAVADKFESESREIAENDVPKKTMDQLLKEKLEEAQAALNDDSDLIPLVKPAIPKRSSIDSSTVRNGSNALREDNVTYTPINVADNFGTNVPDDVKVSRYPFGSLERPKSDVLKKLLAQKITFEERENNPVNRTTMTILPDEQLIENEPQPISLTLIGGGIESDKTESSQISPVYSSDNMGVNSINISSMDIPVQMDNNTAHLTRILPDADNVVTISTDASQPSSIIMIDDECLDFTLQTPPPERTPSPVPQEEEPDMDTNSLENTSSDTIKTFITEIRVATPDEKNHSQEDNFPRNSEIKFTTSTYESPNKVTAEKRISQIEQIRSNFEKSHSQSEIPVPVRKSSIPTLKLSPSKIPVFNSKSQEGGQPAQPRTNNNKVSVSVTSIKNSARHPSGK